MSKSKCTKQTILGSLLFVEMSKKCTPLWREAHFQVKMYKTHQVRTTFGSCDVEKVHAVVARSTFRSQYVKNTTCSRHFWTLRCRSAWQVQGIIDLVKSEKNIVFRDFPSFSRTCIFFVLRLCLFWSSFFYSPLLSASVQLCFSSVHIVGSLTSKLPSITHLEQFWRYQ